MSRIATFVVGIILLNGAWLRADSTAGVAVYWPDNGKYVIRDVDVDLPVKKGAIVLWADESGPGYAGGLRMDDVITHIGGKAIANADDASAAFSAAPTGKPLSVVLKRAAGTGGKPSWHPVSVKIKPVDKIAFLKSVVTSKVVPSSGAKVYHYDAKEKTRLVESRLECSVVETNGDFAAVIEPTYVGDLDWLFVRKLTFLVGDKRLGVDLKLNDVKRENDAHNTWEQCYIAVTKGTAADEVFQALAKMDVRQIVFEGDKRYATYDVKIMELWRAKVMHDFFELVCAEQVSVDVVAGVAIASTNLFF